MIGPYRGTVQRRRRDSCPAHALGFTLVEMVVTLLILAILVTVGIPSFSNATLGSRLASSANDLVASAYLARSEAMKRNRSVTLCTSTNGTSCATSGGWEQGWIVLETASSTVILHHPARSGGLKVTPRNAANTAFYRVVFLPTGIGVTLDAGSVPATFTVCRATPDAGNQERVVTIAATGKPSVARTENGACS